MVMKIIIDCELTRSIQRSIGAANTSDDPWFTTDKYKYNFKNQNNLTTKPILGLQKDLISALFNRNLEMLKLKLHCN